jgi:hypothetical protein
VLSSVDVGSANPQDQGLVAAEVAGDLFGQGDEGGVEGAGQGGDHLAGRLLAAALDLGEVLGREAGPGRGLGERLVPVLAQRPEPAAERFPPQGLRGR